MANTNWGYRCGARTTDGAVFAAADWKGQDGAVRCGSRQATTAVSVITSAGKRYRSYVCDSHAGRAVAARATGGDALSAWATATADARQAWAAQAERSAYGALSAEQAAALERAAGRTAQGIDGAAARDYRLETFVRFFVADSVHRFPAMPDAADLRHNGTPVTLEQVIAGATAHKVQAPQTMDRDAVSLEAALEYGDAVAADRTALAVEDIAADATDRDAQGFDLAALELIGEQDAALVHGASAAIDAGWFPTVEMLRAVEAYALALALIDAE